MPLVLSIGDCHMLDKAPGNSIQILGRPYKGWILCPDYSPSPEEQFGNRDHISDHIRLSDRRGGSNFPHLNDTGFLY